MSQPEERGPGRMDRGKPGRRSTVVVCHTRVLSSPQELCTNFKVSTFRHRVSSLSSRGLLVVGQICTAPAPGGRCRQTGQEISARGRRLARRARPTSAPAVPFVSGALALGLNSDVASDCKPCRGALVSCSDRSACPVWGPRGCSLDSATCKNAAAAAAAAETDYTGCSSNGRRG